MDNFVIPFGIYKGKTIDAVAATDEGLKYLDWLVGELDRKATPQFYMALTVYLSNKLLEDK